MFKLDIFQLMKEWNDYKSTAQSMRFGQKMWNRYFTGTPTDDQSGIFYEQNDQIALDLIMQQILAFQNQ